MTVTDPRGAWGKFWQNLKRPTKFKITFFFFLSLTGLYIKPRITQKTPELLICQLQLCIKDASLIWHCKLGVQKWFESKQTAGDVLRGAIFSKGIKSGACQRVSYCATRNWDVQNTHGHFSFTPFSSPFLDFYSLSLATRLYRCSCGSCSGHHYLLIPPMYHPKCPFAQANQSKKLLFKI